MGSGARFEYQAIRGAEGLSAQEAALDLANVLYDLIEPDSSREGQLRRGEAMRPGAAPGGAKDEPSRIESRDPDREKKILAHRGIAVDENGFVDFGLDDPESDPQAKPRHAFPELEGLTLECVPTGDAHRPSRGAGDDYQR